MCAPVAQLDRATGYEPVGREFESLRAHHSFLTLQLPQGTTKNNGKDRRSLCGFIPLRTLLNNQLLEHFRFTCCRLKVVQGGFFSRKKPRGFPVSFKNLSVNRYGLSPANQGCG
jgi:hypothetical protein